MPVGGLLRPAATKGILFSRSLLPMSTHKFAIRSGLVALFLLVLSAMAANGQPACKGKDLFYSYTCAGDTNSGDETALFDLVNKYRVASGQPELRLSPPLSKLANRRLLDLQQNMRVMTHSWSNCPYDIKDESTWPCVIEAPKRLNSGYIGEGYETLYRVQTGKATAALALEAWKKSSLHNSIILNQGMFKDTPWNEVGVGLDGAYAVLWFGYPGKSDRPQTATIAGLGVTYDQAVAGMAKMLTIEQTSSSVENNIWQGFSSDKKIRLEVYGVPKEIGEANVSITVKLEENGKLDANSKSVLTKFLTNIFPEWPDIEAWIDRSVNAISLNRTASRTKLVRKVAIEMSADGQNSIKVSIAPETKSATEVD